MVEPIKCDLCGAEARHVVTKEFDGQVMNFCCRGCLAVYELQREEIFLTATKASSTPQPSSESK
jgi:ribosome-binding protein aMBF1 (putative translation factor)